VQSRLYILLGIVTAAAVMAACAAVVETLAHQLIEISQFGYPGYLTVQELRYEFAQYKYAHHVPRTIVNQS